MSCLLRIEGLKLKVSHFIGFLDPGVWLPQSCLRAYITLVLHFEHKILFLEFLSLCCPLQNWLVDHEKEKSAQAAGDATRRTRIESVEVSWDSGLSVLEWLMQRNLVRRSQTSRMIRHLVPAMSLAAALGHLKRRFSSAWLFLLEFMALLRNSAVDCS